MSLSAGAGHLSLADHANRGIFFRLATDPVVRVWSGRAKIRVAANSLDAEAEIYYGVGSVTGLPELDRLINGEARRVTVTMSGLKQEVVDLIDSDFADLEHPGVQARFGHLRYDRLWQPTSTIRWLWDGLLDEVSLEAEPMEGGQLWQVHLSMSTALVDANRPELRFWTPQAANPGDLGFDFVPGLNEGTTRVWPPR